MKFISIILSILICFAIVQPVASQVWVIANEQNSKICDKDCCSQDITDKKKLPVNKKSSDCCPNGSCNPFVACSCCFGVPICLSLQLRSKINLNGLFKFINAPDDKLPSGVVLAFFQPPEMV